MKPVDDAPFPVPSLASPEDLGKGLASSQWDVGLSRPSNQILSFSRITLIWLLFGGVLALAALYQLIVGEEGISFLTGMGFASAVAMFLGAGLIHIRNHSTPVRSSFQSQPLRSWLLLLGFVIPLAQVLLTLVVTQENSLTTLLLLLVLGYAAVTPTPESLLHFLAVALFSWAACQLRMPSGTWLSFVIPWVVTALLALAMQKRFSRDRLMSLLAATPSRRVASSNLINVDAEQRLEAALRAQADAEAARDAARSELQHALVEQKSLAQQWQNHRDTFDQESNDARQQLQQSQVKLKSLQQQFDAAQVELAQLRQRTGEDKRWQAEAERWQRQAQDAETEYDSLVAENDQLTHRLKSAQQELLSLNSAAPALDTLTARLAELESKLKEAEQNARSAQQRLQQAENQRLQAEKDRQDAEAAWQQAEDELSRVRLQLKTDAPAKDETAISVQRTVENDHIQPTGIGPRFFSGLTRTLEPPLTTLLEHADTLLDGGTDNETRRHALIGVLRHGRHFRRLLTNAFDYAHLEAGSALITKGPCSPWQLVHDVVAEQRSVAEEKGLDIIIEPAGALPRSITTDSDRCCRILQQLVRNALRFSSVGQITIRLALEQAPITNPGITKLRIDVEDQGPGLADDQHVFEPFGKPTHLGGSGFGLALAHKQAQVIQAELCAENLAHTGSRFSLFLPVTAIEAEDLIEPEQLFVVDEETPADLLRHPLQGKVLLVLDGQEQQRVVAYHLERLGLRTKIMADGKAALTRLQEESFPILLWDWHKTDVPVLRAVQQLRQCGYQGAILSLGNQATAPQRESFMLAGGDAILARPIVPAIWRQTLAVYLPSEAEFNSSNDILPSDFSTDREFMTLVRSYVVKLPGLLAEMRAALQVADLAHLIKQVHALADSSQLYGYPALAEEAQQLEQVILKGRDTPHVSKLLDSLETMMHKIDRGIKLARSEGTIALPSPLTIAA